MMEKRQIFSLQLANALIIWFIVVGQEKLIHITWI